jgi:hypothetical protein
MWRAHFSVKIEQYFHHQTQRESIFFGYSAPSLLENRKVQVKMESSSYIKNKHKQTKNQTVRKSDGSGIVKYRLTFVWRSNSFSPWATDPEVPGSIPGPTTFSEK